MIVETRYYVTKKLQGDTLTPIAVYQALKGKFKMLFESNAKHEESGRYSFIACNPIAELYGNQSKSSYLQFDHHDIINYEKPVLDVLNDYLPQFNEQLPFSFFGGIIGHFNYETAFHVEKIGEYIKDSRNIPDVHVLFYNSFIVFDHLEQTVTVVAIDLDKKGNQLEKLHAIILELEQQITEATVYEKLDEAHLTFEPTIAKEDFVRMVESAKEHIYCGNIFQIVLSQRFESAFEGNPFALYRKLRIANPSPYMFYMDFDEYTVLGTSPESLVKIQDGIVSTNPIAGTKKRGKTQEEDESIAKELLNDEKEIAEHKMLVDLGRNDIGRVCKVGSVALTKYMTIEKYKHVMHIVSEVKGTLSTDKNAIDVIKACLPAGTVSGAPKIRAMQLINEMEPTRRGIYAGAIGYISANGNLDLALAIRTMIVKDGKAYVQAGAGVVYDSIPESEYEETLNKARALLEVQK